MEIYQVKISEIKPYKNNAKLHPEKQINQIVISIKEFGFNVPILIDENNVIIAGHGRYFAAKKLGMDTIPAIKLEHLTEAKKRAFIIADNKLNMNTAFDMDLLKEELQAMESELNDLTITGFEAEELDLMLNGLNGTDKEYLTDADEVPEEPEKPTTTLGDIWVLGRHRLMCGDSTNEENVKALLHGAEPHLMVTDPPYGVEYDANWRNEALKSNGKPLGDRAIGKVANDNRADWTEAWRLFKGDVCYVWHASIFSDVVAISLKNCDFEMKALIIWNKSNFAIGRSHYHHKHEPCWYAIKKGMTGHWQGSRKETTVWDIAKPQKSETGHSTQKPIECMEKPIINNSQIDNHVYEPFCGSGTTLIACEKTNRKCLAMELEPKYCDVIITRWENFTGEKAIHAESNKTFEQLKKEKNNE